MEKKYMDMIDQVDYNKRENQMDEETRKRYLEISKYIYSIIYSKKKDNVSEKK